MILERLTAQQVAEVMAWMRRDLLPSDRADLRASKVAFAITHAPHGSTAPLKTYVEFFSNEPAEPQSNEPQTPQQMERAFERMSAARRQKNERSNV